MQWWQRYWNFKSNHYFFTVQTIYKIWIMPSKLKSFCAVKKILIMSIIQECLMSPITETKRFDVQLFWCSLDPMALTLLLLLNFIFLFFSWFCFYHYYVFNFFRFFFLLSVDTFFVPRYIATYICISGDCKFFRSGCIVIIENKMYFKRMWLMFTW